MPKAEITHNLAHCKSNTLTMRPNWLSRVKYIATTELSTGTCIDFTILCLNCEIKYLSLTNICTSESIVWFRIQCWSALIDGVPCVGLWTQQEWLVILPLSSGKWHINFNHKQYFPDIWQLIILHLWQHYSMKYLSDIIMCTNWHRYNFINDVPKTSSNVSNIEDVLINMFPNKYQ